MTMIVKFVSTEEATDVRKDSHNQNIFVGFFNVTDSTGSGMTNALLEQLKKRESHLMI